DSRVPDGLRLIDARKTDTENGVFRPLVRAVQPAAFFRTDDVEVDETRELRIPLRSDASGSCRRALPRCAGAKRRRRLQDRCISLVDPAPEPDLLVQPPSAHLHAGVAQSGEAVAREAEFVGVQVGGDAARRAIEPVM